MKKGDVVLFKNQGGFIANSISKVTGSEFVHVGIIFDMNKDSVYIAEAKNKGFILNVYNKKLLNDKSKYIIKRPKHRLTQIKKVIIQYIGNDYGFLQLLNIMIYRYLHIRLPGDGVDTLICSEVIARVLFDCNSKINLEKEFDTPFDYITPELINKSKYLE